MKYICTLTVILISSVNLYPQEYEPMLGDSNVWYIFTMPEGYSTEIISVTVDSIIEDKHYKLLGENSFIREDTANKKVYMKYKYNDLELLWFDFSLNTGDSILIKDICYGQTLCTIGYFYVDSICNINTLSGNRKSIYLTGPPNEYDIFQHPVWVEGIGSLGHIYYRYASTSLLYLGELGCFFKDGILIFESELAIEFDTCFLVSPGSVDDVKNNGITIYPNPFSDQISIEGIENDKVSIEIYDVFGREIYRDIAFSVNSHTINTAEINPGLYLICVRSMDNGGAVTSKIIIKR
jgi:hypothetical protein